MPEHKPRQTLDVAGELREALSVPARETHEAPQKTRAHEDAIMRHFAAGIVDALARLCPAADSPPEPLWGTDPWYAKEIRDRIAFIPWLLKAGESKAAVSAAGELGSLLARAAFCWGPDLKLGRKARASARAAAKIKADCSEEDGATLVRRFEAIRASSDELTDADICRRIAADLERGRLTLKKRAKPTAAAVARRIQRYRAPLR